MRVTSKSTTSTSAAPAQSGSAKSAPVSFLDMLSGAPTDSASGIGISDSKFQGQSGRHSGAHDSDEPNKSSADSAQNALLSNLASMVPTPIEVNTLAVVQPGAIVNLDGATKGAESISLAGGQAANPGAGVIASTTQIAPSLLADLPTASVRSFQDIEGNASASAPSTGNAMDQNSQVAADQQTQSAQVPPVANDLSHAAKAGLQQAMSESLQAAAPQASSQDSKSNSMEKIRGDQPSDKPSAEVISALASGQTAVAANLTSLPLSPNQGIATGSAGPINGISNSLRAWNPQSKTTPNATNSDGKATDSKTEQTSQASSSNGTSHGADNNSQQNQDPQANAGPESIPAKTAAVVPAHLIPAASISKPGDALSAATTTPASDSGTHRNAESGSVTSDPLTTAASAGASGINAARVIQSMSGTEMRVGMHSSDFGEISIRTTLSPLQLQTQISVNHSELGSAIATHIPAMQAKLGSEHGVHASIEVSQTGSSLSGNPGQSSSQRNQRAFVPAAVNVTDPAQVDAGYSGLRAPPTAIDESRLDIRA